MSQIPLRETRQLPTGLSVESPPSSLASLTITPAIQSVIDAGLSQWENRAAFDRLAKFGIHPIRQMLFYGPPGNGKTTCAQMMAHRLGVPLFRVRCEALISSYVGQSAGNVGSLLHWLTTAGRAIVLLDEIETIFPARSASEGVSNLERSAAMAVLWQHLDRWSTPQLFIFATNMVDRLDQALLSRIELKVCFDGPTVDQAMNVIDYWEEALHDHGSSTWAPLLRDRIRDSGPPESFRSLWQDIRACVVAHVCGAADSGGNPDPDSKGGDQ